MSEDLTYYLDLVVRGDAKETLDEIQQKLDEIPGEKDITVSVEGGDVAQEDLEKTADDADDVEDEGTPIRIRVDGPDGAAEKIQEALSEIPNVLTVTIRAQVDRESFENSAAQEKGSETLAGVVPQTEAPLTTPVEPPPAAAESGEAVAESGEAVAAQHGTDSEQYNAARHNLDRVRDKRVGEPSQEPGAEPPAYEKPPVAEDVEREEPNQSSDTSPVSTAAADALIRAQLEIFRDAEAGNVSENEAARRVRALSAPPGPNLPDEPDPLRFDKRMKGWTPKDLDGGVGAAFREMAQEGGKFRVTASGSGETYKSTVSTTEEADSALAKLAEMMTTAAWAGEKTTASISGVARSLDTLTAANKAFDARQDEVAARVTPKEQAKSEADSARAALQSDVAEAEQIKRDRAKDARASVTAAADEWAQSPEGQRQARFEKNYVSAKGSRQTHEEAISSAEELETKWAAKFNKSVSGQGSVKSPDEIRQERIGRDYTTARSYRKTHEEASSISAALEADRLKKFNESLGKATENLSSFGQGMQMIQRGALRAGVAKMVSGAFGQDSTAGAFVGAFSGVVASAIAFPMAWAIGDAVMNSTKLAGEVVLDRRYIESISAKADGTVTGKEWIKQAAILEEFAGKRIVAGKDSGQDFTNKMLHAYQAHGTETGDPTKGARAAYYALLLSSGEVENNPEQMVRAMKDLEDKGASPGTRTSAMQAIASREYVKRKLMEKELSVFPKGTRDSWQVRSIAEQRVKDRLSFEPDKNQEYSYSTSELFAYIEDEATRGARVKGDVSRQRDEMRWWGERGFKRALGPYQTEQIDVTAMNAARHILTLEEQRKQGEKKFWDQGVWHVPWAAKTYEQAVESARQSIKQAQQWAGKPSDDAFVDKIIQIRRAKGGDLESLYSEPRNETKPAPQLSKYQWTSFSGLADQMQMMWSGAPPDTGKWGQDDLDKAMMPDQAMNGPPVDAMAAVQVSLDILTGAVKENTLAQLQGKTSETLGDPVPMIPVS